MTCKNCGAQLEEGSVFCANCGTSVETVVTATEEQNPGKVLGIVSLVCSLVGPLLSYLPTIFTPIYAIPFLGWILTIGGVAISLIAGILSFAMIVTAVITGAMGYKKSKTAGFKNVPALIGMILGIIFLVIRLIAIVVAVVLMIAGVSIGGLGIIGAIMNEMTFHSF